MKAIYFLILIHIVMFGCKNKRNDVCLSGDLSGFPDLKSSIHKEVTFERGVILDYTNVFNSNFINENSFLLTNNIFHNIPRVNAYVITLSYAGITLVYANENSDELIDSIPSKINELIQLIEIETKKNIKQKEELEVINSKIKAIEIELNK